MTMKYRTIAAVTCVGALTALAACATDGAAADKALEVWMPTTFAAATADEEAATWRSILAPFEEEHGVEVNVTLVPWASYEEKYLTGVSSGQGPDVGYMYTEMMGDYVSNGALASFDDHLSEETTSKMLYLDQGKVDGSQYAMPFVVGGIRLLWGNMDLLASAGIDEVPTTWDEFLDDARTLHDAGITPLYQEWGAPNRGMLNATYFPLLWQAGGEILNEEGTATAFNSDAGLAAAEFLKTLLDEGLMPADVSGLTPEEVQSAFYKGETAFFFGSDGTWADLEQAEMNAEFVPGLVGKQAGTFVASDALVMFESCADKQLCADLVAFLLGGDQMAEFHQQIVAYPPVATDEQSEPTKFTETYAESAQSLHSLPIAAGGAGVYNALYENLQQMVLGQKSPQQALADAAEAGDAALAQVR